ncbi:hypothetical protein ACFPM3_00725 [Streptomyces coeruleoprunus]|uniref:Integral membrane protein n=2 Tax=Streptomyces coeruleoprunus TaxID=285563 RepID=A0ABV9XAD8_9ACTN
MDLDKRPQGAGEGCLTAAVRIPVRLVVLIVVVPVRMLWDALVVCARALHRSVLRPLGRVLFVIPLTWLWRWVLVPVGRGVAWLVTYGLVTPAVWVWRQVLTPLGRGVAWLAGTLVTYLVVKPAVWVWRWVLVPLGRGAAWLVTYLLVKPVVWLVTYLVVKPAVWLWERVLVPVGRGLVWLVTYLVVKPVVWLVTYLVVKPAQWVWRWVFVPVGRAVAFVAREIGDAFAVAWRVAGHVSRAVGRALKWVARQLVGRPVAWVYRTVCTPVGHWVRDAVWRPVRAALATARDTVRRARREAWRALVGGGPAVRPREPQVAPARTLGSTTTAPGAAPAPEISPRKRG